MLLACPAELLARTAILIYVFAGSGGERYQAQTRPLLQAAVANRMGWPQREALKQAGHPLNGWRVDHRGTIRDAHRHKIGVWGVDSDDAGSQR